MKNLFTIFIVSLLVLLSSCETEKVATHSGATVFKAEKISFEKFKRETGLTNFDTQINIRTDLNGFQSRTADGKYELTDFDIETEVIKTMEFQQKKTYSFQIHPKDTISENFFNLIVYKKDNIWENLIIEMKPTPENLNQLQNGLTDNFMGQIRKLYDSGPPPVMTAGCTTITITFNHCQGCEGPCDGCSMCVTTATFNSCDFGSTGPSSGGPGPSGPSGPSGPPTGGSSGPGTGSTGSTWNGGIVVTTPGPDDIVIEPNLDPTSIYDFNSSVTSTPMFISDFQTTIDNSLTHDNTLPDIHNIADFNNFLVGIDTQGKDFEYIQSQPNQKTASSKFWIAGIFGGVQVNIVQNRTPYSISDVNSNAFGFTAGFNWHQTSFDTTIAGNIVTINIFGIINYNLFVDGVGTVYSAPTHLQIKINKTNGRIISAVKVN